MQNPAEIVKHLFEFHQQLTPPKAIPAKELAQRHDWSLDESGHCEQTLIDALKAYITHSPKVSDPTFYKLLYSGQDNNALVGEWVSALTNANMHTYQMSPAATLMELEIIKQLCRLIGFTEGEGLMMSGGSQANWTALLLARDKAFPEANTQGFDSRAAVAFVSDQAHYSMSKAAKLIGLGENNCIKVASDSNGKMRPDALQQAIDDAVSAGKKPFFIAATAGTTVTGAFDSVVECSKIARKHALWLHIDGAWGGPVLFSEQHKHLITGSELADSFTWDAHKLMNVPLTASALLVRDKGHLKRSCSSGGGDYLFHADANADYNIGANSLQCGRRADALKVWLAWKARGHIGYAKKIDYLQSVRAHCCHHIEHSDTLELLAPAGYLNVLFRFSPSSPLSEEAADQLIFTMCRALREQGIGFVDHAHFQGKRGIRLILGNEACTTEQLTDFFEQCTRIGLSLTTD